MAEADPAMRREVLAINPALRVVLVDTIAHLRAEDAGAVVVTGSHGGASSAEYAARVPVRAVFFNDAGGGKDDAGRAAIAILEPLGIPTGTIAHDTAMIGDARDAFENGVISALGPSAAALGFRIGVSLRESLLGQGNAEGRRT